MSENPFQIIAPHEELPSEHKEEVMGSVKTLILMVRFVQLFVSDYTQTLISLFKTDIDSDDSLKS